MEKCLHCGKVLTHAPGRKQKSFCDSNCRNKYFYAKKSKFVKKVMSKITKDEPIYEKGEILPIVNPAPAINPNEKRISELRNELKNPPKNPQIGLKKWIAVRENEIKKLES